MTIQFKVDSFSVISSPAMANVKVVTLLTSLDGSGEVHLGKQNLNNLKISDVKKMINKNYDIHEQEQQLWWKGYILDNDNLTFERACVGKGGQDLEVSYRDKYGLPL